MTGLKTLTIVAVLLAGGASIASAQNGLPTGGYPPVAGGANGNPAIPSEYQQSPALSRPRTCPFVTTKRPRLSHRTTKQIAEMIAHSRKWRTESNQAPRRDRRADQPARAVAAAPWWAVATDRWRWI
jgi:hypothetical protein